MSRRRLGLRKRLALNIFSELLGFDGARTPSRYAILGVHAALQPFVPPLAAADCRWSPAWRTCRWLIF